MSVTVYELWLPILLAGLATHILSTLAWTVLPHHKPEWQKLPGEDEIHGAISAQNVPPGQYLLPFASEPAEMNSDDYKQKQAKCYGMVVLWGSPLSMGTAILKTLIFFMVVAFSIGYLASMALKPGDDFMTVFRFAGTAGILAHCAGLFPGVFWFRRKLAMDLLDKLVWALVTGLIFAAMWPAAAVAP